MELKAQVKQKMTLSANMQQCLEILAMDNTELGEFITEQSMENPIIELTDTAMWTEYTPVMVHVEREQPEDEEEGVREIAASERVNSDLYFQLSEYHLASDVRQAAEYIIESLDGRGYFTKTRDLCTNGQGFEALLKAQPCRSRTLEMALLEVSEVAKRDSGFL